MYMSFTKLKKLDIYLCYREGITSFINIVVQFGTQTTSEEIYFSIDTMTI